MPDTLPKTKIQWEKKARVMGISSSGHLKAAGLNLESGSNFTLRDFLHMHVLHSSRNPTKFIRSKHKDLFPSAMVAKSESLFNTDPMLKGLELMLRTPEIELWTCEDIAETAHFAVALELLHLIAKRGCKDPPGIEDLTGTAKISTPLKSRSTAEATSTEDITAGVSKLSFEPITPRPRHQNYTESPFGNTTLSPGSTVESMVDDETERLREKYERIIFEAGDEQTVNACLMALIMPVAWSAGIHGRVHLDRRALKVLDSGKGDYLYEARVDGIITDKSGDIDSFMEVKRGFRLDKPNVRMQESAQMAALIHNDKMPLPKGETRKRWMVSMGGYEGYLSIATYDGSYVDYLKGEIRPLAFMMMEEYGPFDLTDSRDMNNFLINVAVLMQHIRG